jgi:hypothetical protein
MKILRFFGSELVLGTLIAILSIMTAMSSYQGSMADSEQNKFEILGMRNLNDGNVLYLESNQIWIQDDGNYDNWYLNQDVDPEAAAYYEGNFTDELAAAIERNGPDEYPMDEQYEEELYADANDLFDESETNFDLGSQWDERGDQLQLVMLLMALGLAFAAWASLLKEENNLRYLFALLSIVTLIVGLIAYTGVPAVAG